MLPCGWLLFVALIPLAQSAEPGVKVRITAKGLEYGRQLGMAAIEKSLATVRIPDMSGKKRVSPIGKVKYSFSNMQIVTVGIPTSAVALVPGTGVQLSFSGASVSMKGNWKVKYFRIVKNSGTFDLSAKGLGVTAGVAITRDATGRPEVSSGGSCRAVVGDVRVKFHGRLSWLYNLFRSFIEKALMKQLEKQICSVVDKAVSNLNRDLKTIKVEAKVDKHAEIEYSMVSSPTVSNAYVDLSLKGQFYKIGGHEEPPFSAQAFSLPPQVDNMMYLGVSSFTANSAAFVYHKAGVLSVYITDDMIPRGSPVRLNTKTFGVFIPQIAERFPGLMVKLLVKSATRPTVTFKPDKVTVQANATVTAYAIQPDATLTPLFILNMETSVSGRVSVSGMRLSGAVALNKMDLTLGTSYVGEFKVKSLSSILTMVLRWVVIPLLNTELGLGFPLPTLGTMKLVNPQLHFLQDYMLIGADLQF